MWGWSLPSDYLASLTASGNGKVRLQPHLPRTLKDLTLFGLKTRKGTSSKKSRTIFFPTPFSSLSSSLPFPSLPFPFRLFNFRGLFE